ncbi:ABC transporter substrate-binding protein [Phaeovulum sp. W22_SRMD_FR3]|uniref:ABC transporter substrate-binding protein n=1 Tax=Phaeovulum sp. W22_SRMD_FR3 TaxID=3240274 RepID=UPI003F95F5CE
MFDPRRLFRASILGLASGIALTGHSFAQSTKAVTADRVTFAQIAVLSGPNGDMGAGVKLGIEAAFAEANAKGGIQGRQVSLESHDDGYEPPRALTALRDVIAADSALALIGNVGTPTAAAMAPMTVEHGMPVIAPFTGASFLRAADASNVLNLRPGYMDEGEAWAALLVDQRKYRKIAILYQDDGFGRAGLAALKAALAKREIEVVAAGVYTRNTTAVKAALIDIRRKRPQAVVLVATAKPVATFLETAAKLNFAPAFVNVSFGADQVAKTLGAKGAGLIMTQAVPSPDDTSRASVAAYQAALHAFDPKAVPDHTSFEGYLSGRLALSILDTVGKDVTRQKFLDAMAALKEVKIDDLTLTFGAGDNQGLDAVYFTKIDPTGQIIALPADAS